MLPQIYKPRSDPGTRVHIESQENTKITLYKEHTETIWKFKYALVKYVNRTNHLRNVYDCVRTAYKNNQLYH